jgi:hypothetical protein
MKWTPNDPNDKPLPLSSNYREKLSVLCELMNSGKLSRMTKEKYESLVEMCSQLETEHHFVEEITESENNSVDNSKQLSDPLKDENVQITETINQTNNNMRSEEK